MPKPMTSALVLAAVLGGLGCGGAGDPAAVGDGATAAPVGATPAPELLEPPFTSEEIRSAWVEGLYLTIRRRFDGIDVFERWQVVAADEHGATIESVVVDPAGIPISEPMRQTSSWDELRDHASFPRDRAAREEVTRETALGAYEGWLYTVTDPETGARTEFFFARALPGAPLTMKVLRDGEVALDFEQLERGMVDGG
ncbi:MAG: hypothetical protein MUC56_13465 [Thermoanaerobaculales bacterium]|jgi:hypothetical protein|nr:hypothetical protein [Thermoanaerobaculales bacterium]